MAARLRNECLHRGVRGGRRSNADGCRVLLRGLELLLRNVIPGRDTDARLGSVWRRLEAYGSDIQRLVATDRRLGASVSLLQHCVRAEEFPLLYAVFERVRDGAAKCELAV